MLHQIKIEGGLPLKRVGITRVVYTRTSCRVSDAASPKHSEQYKTAAANLANVMLKPSFSSHTAPDIYPGNLSFLPEFAIKSNLLCAAGTITPKFAVKKGFGDKTSLVFYKHLKTLEHQTIFTEINSIQPCIRQG